MIVLLVVWFECGVRLCCVVVVVRLVVLQFVCRLVAGLLLMICGGCVLV